MLKKVLLTLLVFLGTAALGGSYLFFAGRMAKKEAGEVRCGAIRIVVDGEGNRVLDERDVLALLEEGNGILGQKADSIDLYAIEGRLSQCGEILSNQVFRTIDGKLRIDVAHRRAALRIVCPSGTFYSDPSGYLFPLRHAVDAPVVTGKIPLQIGSRHQGPPRSEPEVAWLRDMLSLGRYIEGHDYWQRQVAQIDVEAGGDLALYMNTGEERFLFGAPDEIEAKFEKIGLYYRGIAPLRKNHPYRCVNLKYKNQIVCK